MPETGLVLEGRLVRLEPLTLDHAPAMATVGAVDRESYGWTNVPRDESSARTYVEQALADKAVVPFATILRSTGALVGSTRFLQMQRWAWVEGSPHQRGADLPDVLEIGATWLSPTVQRTGVNREAKLLMLTWAFETWRVHRVQLRTDSRNERSRRAIEGLGAHLDGVVRAERVGYDGGIRDTATYSILDVEWPAVKRGIEASLSR
jgi:RimJ/RimL family protein N-acetyltransferase